MYWERAGGTWVATTQGKTAVRVRLPVATAACYRLAARTRTNELPKLWRLVHDRRKQSPAKPIASISADAVPLLSLLDRCRRSSSNPARSRGAAVCHQRLPFGRAHLLRWPYSRRDSSRMLKTARLQRCTGMLVNSPLTPTCARSWAMSLDWRALSGAGCKASVPQAPPALHNLPVTTKCEVPAGKQSPLLASGECSTDRGKPDIPVVTVLRDNATTHPNDARTNW